MLGCIFGNKANFKRKSTNAAECYHARETVATVHRAKSPESKAAVSGNAWTDGQWLMLQKDISEMNEVIRQQRKGIGL